MWEKRTNWELGTRVSRHDTAGIWVAFFSRCQRYRCRQATLSGLLCTIGFVAALTMEVFAGPMGGDDL